jgi:ribonuclease HI
LSELFSLESQPVRAEVYTDGGCDPNPGPGGWAAIIRLGECEWVLHGNDPDTTNNRMELQAAVAALALLEKLLGHCQVVLYTDSQYLRQGITEWIDLWLRNGWRTSNKEPVKNQDLWRALHELAQAHGVTWHWLEGHAGHPFNERADQLATQALRTLRTKQTPEAEGQSAVEICIKVAGRGGEAQPCGWAAVLRMGENTRFLNGSTHGVTSNALLIRAATESLQALKRPCRVTVYSDAEYLARGAAEWIKGWQARGWQTKDGKPVANRAEWEALLAASARHHITWRIVTGDDAPPDMERAGQLAAEMVQDSPG